MDTEVFHLSNGRHFDAFEVILPAENPCRGRFYFARGEFAGIATTFALIAIPVLTLPALGFELPGNDMLSSLRLHLAAMAIVIAMALMASGARVRASIFILLILAALAQTGATVWEQQRYRRAASASAIVSNVVVLSYNNPTGEQSSAEMRSLAWEAQADFLAVVESQNIQPYLAGLRNAYPYSIGCDSSDACDILLLSLTPLIDAQLHPLGELKGLRLVTAKTKIDEQAINLVVAQISKPYFDDISIFEIWEIHQLLKQMQGPVILVGNFNNAPWSPDLDSVIHASRLSTAPQYPATWPKAASNFGLPIDTMFTRGGAVIDSIEALPSDYSGRRSLLAKLSLRAAAAE